jgi:hypothetical protein
MKINHMLLSKMITSYFSGIKSIPNVVKIDKFLKNVEENSGSTGTHFPKSNGCMNGRSDVWINEWMEGCMDRSRH